MRINEVKDDVLRDLSHQKPDQRSDDDLIRRVGTEVNLRRHHQADVKTHVGQDEHARQDGRERSPPIDDVTEEEDHHEKGLLYLHAGHAVFQDAATSLRGRVFDDQTPQHVIDQPIQKRKYRKEERVEFLLPETCEQQQKRHGNTDKTARDEHVHQEGIRVKRQTRDAQGVPEEIHFSI